MLGLITKLELADEQFVVGVERARADAFPIDVCAIGGMKVEQLRFALFDHNQRMVFGDAAVVEMQGVSLRATDGDELPVQLKARRRDRARQRVQLGHNNGMLPAPRAFFNDVRQCAGQPTAFRGAHPSSGHGGVVVPACQMQQSMDHIASQFCVR